MVNPPLGAHTEGPETGDEVEPLVLGGNEVKDGQLRLLLMQAQSPPQLLEKNCHAFGGSEEEHRINEGDIDPFIVQIHGEDEIDLTLSQLFLDSRSQFPV